MIFTRGGCFYMTANKYNDVIYCGVSSTLVKRVWEHKNKVYSNCFTAKYNCDKLVYYKFFSRIEEAIEEEKRVKGCSRAYKVHLIESMNTEWKDIYDDLLNG